jgi:hypothetical protein
MSQLVLVTIGKPLRQMEFQVLTGEPLMCLESYADADGELFSIRQFGYHPEYGATLYEIIVDWGDSNHPGPRQAALGIPSPRTDLDLAVKKLMRQYEEITATTCTLVRHEGRITRCSFKPKGEYQDSPTDLEWTKVEPPAQELL